jgi:endo-1,3-1,4-beta-glycanase ExoK
MKIKNLLFVFIILLILINNIYSQDKAKDYKSGEVYSHEAVLFGKFEVRAKLVSEKGIVSSFFLYDNLSWQGKPYPWREIDIEAIGKEKDLFQTNIITGFADKRITSENVVKVKNIDSVFHTFTIEWTPDYIAWYVDDELIRKDTAKNSRQVIDLRDTPQTYRMNLWIAVFEDWVGKYDEDTLPLYQYINWIKYYEYTPGKGENGTDFTHKWTDNFDKFDSKRWGKGNWTFDGNLVDFSQSNVVIKDGYLIICLTKKDESGFHGKLQRDNR